MGLIAVGDIHGCSASMEALLDKISPTSDDHLIFIGDYIDRGPDSRGVIERLIELSATHRCTFLRGNHEAMMLDYVDYGELELWRLNGGLTTLASYVCDGHVRIPQEHVDFVRNTLLFHQEKDFFFVHAGLNPRLTIEENLARSSEQVFLWERSHFSASRVVWEKPVVCGHTPQAEPINLPHLICIDTGCVYYRDGRYGRLTAIRLPEREMVMVPFLNDISHPT